MTLVGSYAAEAVGHRESEISADFSRPVIPAADPVLAFSGPRNSKAVVHLKKPVFLVEGPLSSVTSHTDHDFGWLFPTT